MSNLENTSGVVSGPTSLRVRRDLRLGDQPIAIGWRLKRSLLWLAWRYRYLLSFMLYGFLSIVLEVVLIAYVFPSSWPNTVKSIPAFLAGMLFAFFMNTFFNFRVPPRQSARAFFFFALVSILSYSLNLGTITWLDLTDYPLGRLATAGCLFMVAYSLHRRFTFRDTARNLGLAVYASREGGVREAFEHVGDLCDHIHFDLIDTTFDPLAAPVDVSRIDEARRLWLWQPFCLHVMSRRPLRWIEECWDVADCVLVHLDIDDDVMEVIARCREMRCKVGVVWHHTVSYGELMPYLPHVDYVMVLGIDQPGHSGQPLMQAALEAVNVLDGLTSRYGYELIFDGGVTKDNVGRIPARIVVSSSAVLRAENPGQATLLLRAA